MAVPTISLLEEKPYHASKCEMCGTVTRKNKFSFTSYFTGETIIICRECAYREKFGTKKMNKAKKERILEKK